MREAHHDRCVLTPDEAADRVTALTGILTSGTLLTGRHDDDLSNLTVAPDQVDVDLGPGLQLRGVPLDLEKALGVRRP